MIAARGFGSSYKSQTAKLAAMIAMFTIGKCRALTPSVSAGIGKTADALREDRSG